MKRKILSVLGVLMAVLMNAAGAAKPKLTRKC